MPSTASCAPSAKSGGVADGHSLTRLARERWEHGLSGRRLSHYAVATCARERDGETLLDDRSERGDLHLVLAGERSVLARVRAKLAAFLDRHAIGDEVYYDALLVAHELTANAVKHGSIRRPDLAQKAGCEQSDSDLHAAVGERIRAR